MSSVSPPSSLSISNSPSVQSTHSVSLNRHSSSLPHALSSTHSSSSFISNAWDELSRLATYPPDHQNPDYSSDFLNRRTSESDFEVEAQNGWDSEHSLNASVYSTGDVQNPEYVPSILDHRSSTFESEADPQQGRNSASTSNESINHTTTRQSPDHPSEDLSLRSSEFDSEADAQNDWDSDSALNESIYRAAGQPNSHDSSDILGGLPRDFVSETDVQRDWDSESASNEPIYHAVDYQDPDNSSDILDHHSSTFDSEADTLEDWNPESASHSLSQPSEFDSLSSMSDEIAPHEALFEDPFSPDLADELELALLAEMDQLPQLREQRIPRVANRQGSTAGLRQSGAVSRNSPGDVLVDLELYFQQEQRRPERRNQNNYSNQNNATDVIDLTNEPDSPVQTRSSRSVGDPRRRNSQGRNPPSFVRGDNDILSGGAPVIDLTNDTPEVPRRHAPVLPPPPLRHRERNRQLGAFGRYHPATAIGGLTAGMRRPMYPFRLFPAQEDEVQILGILHDRINHGADLNNPLGNIQLQYDHGAFDRAESPKPVHQAPPPAKSGFTRDTGSDLVVICPACNEELAYEPNLPMSENHPTRKGKRQRSEHHFWALKGCGHVYCEDCFENRKPAARRPNNGFRRDPDSKIICAVEGCETPATNKTGWVGIYL